ncbi:FAD-dependent oxidoreductase (plasmid) [Bartonella sp. HY329]|uniref:FAD-dependent oxidoreductase n=1 Tax=unclassified Bartonella TaxID=2645622 RepID=UPI0021CA4F61|nr:MULTISPECIES: FAD-dependent oxidoreductase [unclassified Bartonella]UXM96594.1 FAD-dependent oxidoreductase [Bartonella sp. HY329]UXN10917.1 FAD-dependent oxidoreductase [Bartonella sp. HY328]
MTKPHAVIIGAGVAGLSAAWWLNKAGWRSTIVERASHLRSKGYMMGLSGLGYETLKKMGLFERLNAVSYKIDENIYKNSKGKEILRLRYQDFIADLPYLAIRRSDLVMALADILPSSADLRLNSTIEDIKDSCDRYDVKLNNGDCISADIILGCDGFRSSLRQKYFDQNDKCLQPLGYYFAVYDIDHAKTFDHDFLSYVEPAHLAEYYGLHDGNLAAMHVWRDNRENLQKEMDPYQILAKVAQNSNQEVRDLLTKAQQQKAPLLIDSLTMVDLPKWYNKNMLLLGDAAHCLTLISGQGAGMALASVEMLSNALLQYGDINHAFAHHDQQLRPIINRLQARSRKMAPMFVPNNPITFHLRNIALKLMPKSWLGHYFTNAIKAEIALTQNQCIK